MKKLIKFSYSILLIAIPVVTFLILSPYEGFLISIMRSWAVQFMIFLYFALLIFLLLEKFKHTVVSLISLILMIFYLNPFLKTTLSKTKENGISIFHLNVLKFNKNYDDVSKKILKENPDIISLIETDALWTNELTQNLKNQYPFYYTFPTTECCYGSSLFSKFPIKNPRMQYFNNYPAMTANLKINNEFVRIIIAHAPSPIYPKKWRDREKYISELALYLKDVNGEKIVCGDFNTVPWESAIINFERTSKLTDSRTSLQPTFPSPLPFLKIPLDYIFHSENIESLSTQLIKGTGSDHYGLLSKFKI
jgi:endonuclease/exonuclease/phosphatase (EEP) superfamily protein YafD